MEEIEACQSLLPSLRCVHLGGAIIPRHRAQRPLAPEWHIHSNTILKKQTLFHLGIETSFSLRGLYEQYQTFWGTSPFKNTMDLQILRSLSLDQPISLALTLLRS